MYGSFSSMYGSFSPMPFQHGFFSSVNGVRGTNEESEETKGEEKVRTEWLGEAGRKANP